MKILPQQKEILLTLCPFLDKIGFTRPSTFFWGDFLALFRPVARQRTWKSKRFPRLLENPRTFKSHHWRWWRKAGWTSLGEPVPMTFGWMMVVGFWARIFGDSRRIPRRNKWSWNDNQMMVSKFCCEAPKGCRWNPKPCKLWDTPSSTVASWISESKLSRFYVY